MTTEATVKMRFDPDVLERNKATEVNMTLDFSAPNAKRQYWCECEVAVRAPLSLSHDAYLEKGKNRVGILGPGRKTISKQIKLFAAPAMSSNDYLVTVTTYLYDDEGIIAERHDTSEVIKCAVQKVSETKL